MKNLLLNLTLVTAAAAAYGQGSVAFSNGALTRLSVQQIGYPDPWSIVPIPIGTVSFKFGLWYGVGSAGAVDTSGAPWVLGLNSSTGAGLIASSLDRKTTWNNVVLGTETSIGETDIWVQIKAWSYQFDTWQAAKAAFGDGRVGYYETDIRNINPLGSPAISGVPIWQNATGTNPKLFNAFVIPVIPEPPVFGLVGLGALLLIANRRK